jgi:SAM-dependent methyltransferase
MESDRPPATVGPTTTITPDRLHGQDVTVVDPLPDRWAPVAERFVEGHYGSLRGRVRTYVVHQHLQQHLPPPPARIVDVGGGAGNQSVPLARLGYDVTIVDPSPEMLRRAEQRTAAERTEVAERVRLVEAGGEDAPDALGGATFDGVLCHGVLMYLDDPGALVGALCRLTGPGGVLSVVAKNVEVMAVRLVHEGDWAGALAAFGTASARQVNGLGMDTRGDHVDDLSARIAGHGVDPVAWYGVRLFTDGWTPERPATDPEELVLEVELAASRLDPYRRLSRLFHLLGRRGTGD